MATIIKGSTKRGQELINRANYYEGYYLLDVYGRWSIEKERRWKYCFDKYCHTTNAHGFHICSHNTFQYSVAWEGIYEAQRAIFLETASNSYIILLDK